MTPLPAGLVGLAQISLLPGILALLWSRKHTGIPPVSALSSLLFIPCFSAVASFLLLLLFQATGINTRTTWLLLGFGEVGAWLYLAGIARLTRQKSAPVFMLQKPSVIEWLAIGLFFVFAAQLGVQVSAHWPGVFEHWDAVINWNRWALDWAQGQWPGLTWGYAQLMPAMWSITYVLQGSTEIEFFARGWMALFPLAFLFLFFDMFLQWRRIAPLLAAVAMVTLLLGSYVQVLDSGYVDVPLAFFTLLTGYWVLQAKHDVERRPTWLSFAATAAAAALLTKQGGLLAFAILLWGLWSCRYERRHAGNALALFLVLVLPWYVMDWTNGTDTSVVPYVTSQIYGEETLSQRVGRALSVTLPDILLPNSGMYLRMAAALCAGAGMLLSLRDRHGRYCLSIGIIYLLIWAAFFSYDGRNLLPAVPFLLLAVLIGLETFLTRLAGILRRNVDVRPHLSVRKPSGEGGRILAMFPPVIVLALLLAAAIPANTAAWDKLNNDLRKQTGDAEFNQQLLAFVSSPDFSGSIYTTYPQVAAIRELRPHLFADFGMSHWQPAAVAALQSRQPLCTVLATFPRHEEIGYLLLHHSVYPLIIDAALLDGSLQTELSTPLMRLMRVNCATSQEVQR